MRKTLGLGPPRSLQSGGSGPGPGSTPDLSGATLSITSGSFAGGDLVTVEGASGIDAGAVLEIAESLVAVRVTDAVDGVNGTTFQFFTPRKSASSTGTKSITITNPNGLTATKANAYTYTAQQVIPSYVSMMALAAGIPDVGMVADLIGATTGDLIGRVTRIAPGLIFDQLTLGVADGTELDGVFEPLSIGSTPSSTWGAAGSRGLILPAGTIALPGWAPMAYYRCGISAKVEGWSYPAEPALHDHIAAGLVSEATDPRIRGGGQGYNTGPTRRATVITGGTAELPTGTYATASITATDGETMYPFIVARQVVNTSQVTYTAGFTVPDKTTGALVSQSTTLWGAVTDLRPAFSRRGDWGGARVTAVSVEWGLPT